MTQTTTATDRLIDEAAKAYAHLMEQAEVEAAQEKVSATTEAATLLNRLVSDRFHMSLPIPEGEDQIPLGNDMFLRASDYRGKHLFLSRECPKCGCNQWSHDIDDVLTLGKALAGEHWGYHTCYPKMDEPVETTESRLLDALRAFIAESGFQG